MFEFHDWWYTSNYRNLTLKTYEMNTHIRLLELIYGNTVHKYLNIQYLKSQSSQSNAMSGISQILPTTSCPTP